MKKIALVTGANKGLGFETCLQLAKNNFTVILTARNHVKGNEAVEKLKKENFFVVFHQMDVSDDDSVKACARFVEQEYGKLDLLINNAGISGSSKGMIDADFGEIKKVMETNFFGPLRVTKYMFPFLKKSEDARVINVSSRMGNLSDLSGDYAGYRLSKAGLNNITLMFANEFSDHAIKVNSISPGWVKTDMGGPNAPLSTEEGVDTIIWLATSSKISSGKFYSERKAINW